MDVFFETLAKTDSEEKAFEALKRYLVKKRLELAETLNSEPAVDSSAELEEIWDLMQKEKALKKIMKRDSTN